MNVFQGKLKKTDENFSTSVLNKKNFLCGIFRSKEIPREKIDESLYHRGQKILDI